MAEPSHGAGAVYDRVRIDQRRLAIGHVTLGFISCAAFWLRHAPPRLYYGPWGFGLLVLGVTFFAWAPYLASWLISHAALPGNSRIVAVFLGLATIITGVSAPLYVTPFGMKHMVSPLLVSFAVSLALGLVGGICTVVAKEPWEMVV